METKPAKLLTIKKTFKELSEIDGIVGGLYQKNPTLRDTKFGYAYKRFSEKNIAPTVKLYSDVLNDIRIDNALTDETTHALLIDKESTRGFKYSKEGLKSVIKEERNLQEKFDVKEIDVEPFISTFVPADLSNLSNEQKELLTGLLL